MSHKHSASSTLRAPPDISDSQERLFPSSVHLLRDSTTDQSGTQTKTHPKYRKNHASCVQGGNSVKTLLGGVLSNVDV